VHEYEHEEVTVRGAEGAWSPLGNALISGWWADRHTNLRPSLVNREVRAVVTRWPSIRRTGGSLSVTSTGTTPAAAWPGWAG